MTDQVADPAEAGKEGTPNTETPAGETPITIGDAPAKAEEAAKPAVAEDGSVEYEPTGDVGLDMALGFIGKQGITADHPAMVAARNGDFTILSAELAAKGAKGWEQFVELGKAAYARTTEAETKKAAERKADVFKAAGGEENWKAVQTWAAANATPEEKAEINELLNKGGLAARGAVKYLVDAYERASNVEVNPKDGTANAGRAPGPDASNGPLDARAYADAVQRLSVKLGGRMESSKEYENLQQRRRAHRG